MSEAAKTSAARPGIEERQLELTKFLMGDDPLGMVLRAHMHIEEESVAFITANRHLKNTIPSKYAHLCASRSSVVWPNSSGRSSTSLENCVTASLIERTL